MHRREFLILGLASSTSALGLGCGPTPAPETPKPMQAAAGSSDGPRLRALLERIFREQLRASPESVTALGFDRGDGARAKSQLDERSIASDERRVQRQKGFLADLRAIDRARLSKADALHYDTVVYAFDTLVRATEQFDYGDKSDSAPYVISQLHGAYQFIPDFLDSQHRIEQKADAEAYIARLDAFSKVLDQETERATREGDRGILPPDFIVAKALIQLEKLRAAPAAETSLVGSVARRAREKQIAGEWEARATRLVEGPVRAALDRQIALLQRWRTKAVHDAGVWRLPRGDAYYAFGAKLHTTTALRADEIHALGLERVAEIAGRVDALMRGQGMSTGTVGERFAALAKDARFVHPNTDAGKAELLQDLRGKVRALEAKLPDYFGALPKARLEVKRVPPDIEAGQPRGRYDVGAIDGSRPGVYSINLRDTSEWAKWYLPTFAYHEGIPGHHLQMTLALEAPDTPMLRKTLSFDAYSEGWALYAEQLADEMGVYDRDPLGRIGMLQSLLFRAVRLVVDSGLHAKRWGREQAIRYMRETLGDPEGKVATEVERYTVWPGQACSYEIGHTRWLALRQYAKEKLGAKFDIRRFHDAALLPGAMPLEVLERVIHDWVRDLASS
ncbi:DUF885 domain-containing protein [Pendulispora albinea]|uniref:DUF885 family protein n=1 Tax=Pendulispora albinea TaxID=2741071 RepID=A0ABZ2LW17_9BACT